MITNNNKMKQKQTCPMYLWIMKLTEEVPVYMWKSGQFELKYV